MLTYALTVFLVVNGQVHTETLDYGLSQEDCEVLQYLADVDGYKAYTEADVLPLACVAERGA